MWPLKSCLPVNYNFNVTILQLECTKRAIKVALIEMKVKRSKRSCKKSFEIPYKVFYENDIFKKKFYASF